MIAAGSDGHAAWLEYPPLTRSPQADVARALGCQVSQHGASPTLRQAGDELVAGIEGLLGVAVGLVCGGPVADAGILMGTAAVPELAALVSDAGIGDGGDLGAEAHVLLPLAGGERPRLAIIGGGDVGCLYGAFELLRLIGTGAPLPNEPVRGAPAAPLRMLDHWDDITGDVERGYAGSSIFFVDGEVTRDLARVREYGRLLASIGVNALAINNVNVHRPAVELLTGRHLDAIADVAATLRPFGVRLALSVNFASPVLLDGLPSADPDDRDVARWWRETVADVYAHVPDLLGFVVKASSEGQPGPHSYGRSQAAGANVIAAALEPFGGIVFWRAFVYDCEQDWRATVTDRAKAAVDEFVPLDGTFAENVAVQIKNGPMDFQVREPASPLFGAAPNTSKLLEVQLTQEYTGQQVHLCYLVPAWKGVLDFDTYAFGEGSTVSDLVVRGRREAASSPATAGSGQKAASAGAPIAGMVGVANVGDERNWTGHLLAQANLYGFGRLAWQPSLEAEVIAREWSQLTFGLDEAVTDVVTSMLMRSPEAYESYTSPLGLGWMVTPHVHYGPAPEGYEYSRWGTYIRADRDAIGVDRGVTHGTGFTAQYHEPWRSIFEDPARCPQELLLFFHRLPYDYVLPSGTTLVQHVYDSHFAGAETVVDFIEQWQSIEHRVDPVRFGSVQRRLRAQLASAEHWRDVINAYFHRYSGVPDERGRPLF
jgi:alpha-glucuronidase